MSTRSDSDDQMGSSLHLIVFAGRPPRMEVRHGRMRRGVSSIRRILVVEEPRRTVAESNPDGDAEKSIRASMDTYITKRTWQRAA